MYWYIIGLELFILSGTFLPVVLYTKLFLIYIVILIAGEFFSHDVYCACNYLRLVSDQFDGPSKIQYILEIFLPLKIAILLMYGYYWQEQHFILNMLILGLIYLPQHIRSLSQTQNNLFSFENNSPRSQRNILHWMSVPSWSCIFESSLPSLSSGNTSTKHCL